MAGKKTTTLKFYQDVREAYLKWSERREGGKKIYTDEYIFMKLAERFYRSPKTIENIVFHRVGDETPVGSVQGDLFGDLV